MKNSKYESAAYWTQLIQLSLYDHIASYMQEHNLSRKQLADKLGVSKGYVSQLMNGDYNHKLSKLVELSLACDFVPSFRFIDKQYAKSVERQSYLEETPWEGSPSYKNEEMDMPVIGAIDSDAQFETVISSDSTDVLNEYYEMKYTEYKEAA